jgi:ribonuclease-3
MALEMGLDEAVNFNPPPNTEKSSIMGNALEALIGAIYLDQGYNSTRRFVVSKMLKSLVNIEELEKTEFNFKSKLLEWGQKGNIKIEFVLLEEVVKEGRPFFHVAVKVKGHQKGAAGDFNKKRAEQQAAEKAIESMRIS